MNNFKIWSILQREDIGKTIRINRLQWFDHVRRISDSKELNIEERKRLKKPWEDQVQTDMKDVEHSGPK